MESKLFADVRDVKRVEVMSLRWICRAERQFWKWGKFFCRNCSNIFGQTATTLECYTLFAGPMHVELLSYFTRHRWLLILNVLKLIRLLSVFRNDSEIEQKHGERRSKDFSVYRFSVLTRISLSNLFSLTRGCSAREKNKTAAAEHDPVDNVFLWM